MTPITSINTATMLQMPTLPALGTPAGTGFQNALQSAIDRVQGSQNVANDAIQKFVSGEDQELHSTILATQNAELQFEMLMQVRNKVVSAYEEIMKMPI
jgi:flagellar hook-basal body complex protein FliE